MPELGQVYKHDAGLLYYFLNTYSLSPIPLYTMYTYALGILEKVYLCRN